ncbi:23S rRNA (guanosine(2251)-2'-O)-methyltransferase RlmB [Allofustis seminis]|uniref:23S rRNA (guanosine(2251)-2'-O)-methyltransferase RlmB n=1 Tax=Allofustis seminis TaxID=166939 RepID=UPI003CCBA299
MPKMTNDALHERFVIGRHPVESALEMHRDANKLFIQEDSRGAVIERIIAYAKEANVPYTFVPKMKLDQMAAGQNHQGVLLMSSAVKYASLNDLFQVAQSRQEDPFFILLDGIEDPHNLGSILRTADAAGAHGVIILKHRAVGLTATVAKTAAGSLERVKVARVTNMVDTIEELKQRGLWIFGSDMDGVDYRQWQATGPIGVVIGNEGKGLSKRVSEHVDEKVCLPMIGGTESLNASVAASLLIYEVFRTRHPLT